MRPISAFRLTSTMEPSFHEKSHPGFGALALTQPRGPAEKGRPTRKLQGGNRLPANRDLHFVIQSVTVEMVHELVELGRPLALREEGQEVLQFQRAEPDPERAGPVEHPLSESQAFPEGTVPEPEPVELIGGDREVAAHAGFHPDR